MCYCCFPSLCSVIFPWSSSPRLPICASTCVVIITSNHNSAPLSPSLLQDAEFFFLLYDARLLYSAISINRAQSSTVGTIYKDYDPLSYSSLLSYTPSYLLHIHFLHFHKTPTTHLPITSTCHPLDRHHHRWFTTHDQFLGSFPRNIKTSLVATTRSPQTTSGTQHTPSPPPWHLHTQSRSSKPLRGPQRRRQPTPPPVQSTLSAPRVVGKPALVAAARSLLKALYSVVHGHRLPRTLGVAMSSPGSRLKMRL